MNYFGLPFIHQLFTPVSESLMHELLEPVPVKLFLHLLNLMPCLFAF